MTAKNSSSCRQLPVPQALYAKALTLLKASQIARFFLYVGIISLIAQIVKRRDEIGQKSDKNNYSSLALKNNIWYNLSVEFLNLSCRNARGI